MAKPILPSSTGERPISSVALYVRVSTLNGQHPEMQLAELREYAARRGSVDWHPSLSRMSNPRATRRQYVY